MVGKQPAFSLSVPCTFTTLVSRVKKKEEEEEEKKEEGRKKFDLTKKHDTSQKTLKQI